MNFAGLVKRGKYGSTYTGGLSTKYSPVNQAWLVMWHDQLIRVLDTRAEAEHYATQMTTEGVESLHPRREEKRRHEKERAHRVLESAAETMAQDPGFQQLARDREHQAKLNRLKYGRQGFHIGGAVHFAELDRIPWVGIVRPAQYLEDGIDGPGWYYDVDWRNEELKQYHGDYVHQDMLRPA